MPRFMRRGITKFFWIPTATSSTVVTAAQVNAGVNVTPQIAEVSGFNFANSPITTPNMEEEFTPQIPGEDTAADSSITFYEIRGATDTIHDAQPKGDTGYMVIFFGGIAGSTPAAGDDADVWPATVGSNSRGYSAGNEAATYVVNYSITAPPGEDVNLT